MNIIKIAIAKERIRTIVIVYTYDINIDSSLKTTMSLGSIFFDPPTTSDLVLRKDAGAFKMCDKTPKISDSTAMKCLQLTFLLVLYTPRTNQ